MNKKKSSYSENLKGINDVFKMKLEQVKEARAHPDYRWNPNDRFSDLQETIVQLETLKMLVDYRKDPKWSDEDYYDLILLFRNGYKTQRTIHELLHKSELTDKEQLCLLDGYMFFKQIDPKLLDIFLDKEDIEKCESLLKGNEERYSKREQRIPLLFI